MKILLINNYQQGNETATFEALRSALAGHQVKMQRYQPGITFDDQGCELVILTGGGGEGSEINDQYSKNRLWHQDQINYILSSTKPILGICMGFEVIARAYGSQVVEMKDYITGFKRLVPTKTGAKALKKDSLVQYENHRYYVPHISSKHFEVLAQSKTGVEIIKHKKRPILATQFHPEKGGSLNLTSLIAQLT
jgi:anthranilate/para-aminobenzoate synthase component II